MKFQELTNFPSGKKCPFCKSSDVNLSKLGNIYSFERITVHYFCLLLASDVKQKGLDNQGILGFLPLDINNEVKRGDKINCAYCCKSGATVVCAERSCGINFHLNCGIRNNSIHFFFQDFTSYCGRHRKYQTIPYAYKKKIIDPFCIICRSKVILENRSDIIWPSCCKPSSLLHRDCVQKLALSSGYYFKCPLCLASDNFLSQMKNLGIFIPEQEASWENNATFGDLLHNEKCEANKCLCPKGRQFKRKKSRFDLISCDLCGGMAIHLVCAGFTRNFTKQNHWICTLCQKLESKKNNPQTNTEIETETSTNNNIITIGTDNISWEVYYQLKNLCYTSKLSVALQKLPDNIQSACDEGQNIMLEHFTSELPKDDNVSQELPEDVVSQEIPKDNNVVSQEQPKDDNAVSQELTNDVNVVSQIKVNDEICSDEFELDDKSLITFEDYKLSQQPFAQLVDDELFQDNIIKDENLECSDTRKRKFNEELSSDGSLYSIDIENNYLNNNESPRKRSSSSTAFLDSYINDSTTYSWSSLDSYQNDSPISQKSKTQQAQSIQIDSVLPVSAQKTILQGVSQNIMHSPTKDKNLECSDTRKRKFNEKLFSDEPLYNIDVENNYLNDNESPRKRSPTAFLDSYINDSTTHSWSSLDSYQNDSPISQKSNTQEVIFLYNKRPPKQAQSIQTNSVLPVSSEKKILHEGVSQNIIHSPQKPFHQPYTITPCQIKVENSDTVPLVPSPLKHSAILGSAKKNCLQGVSQNITHTPSKPFHNKFAMSHPTPIQIKLEDDETEPVVQSPQKDSAILSAKKKNLQEGVSQNIIHSPQKPFHQPCTPFRIKLEKSDTVQNESPLKRTSCSSFLDSNKNDSPIHQKSIIQEVKFYNKTPPKQAQSILKDSVLPVSAQRTILQEGLSLKMHSPTKVVQTPVKTLMVQPDSTSNLGDVPRVKRNANIEIHIYTINPQGGLGSYLGTSNIKNGDFYNSYFFCTDISDKSCQIFDTQLYTSVFNEKNIKKISTIVKYTNLIFIAPDIKLICKFKIKPISMEKEYEKNQITVNVRKIYENGTKPTYENESSYFESIKFGSFISSLIECKNSIILTDKLGSIYANLIKNYLPNQFKCSIKFEQNLRLNRELNIFKKSNFTALFIISGRYKPDHDHSFFKEIISFITNSNNKRIILSTIPLPKKKVSFQYRLTLNFNKKIINLCSQYGIDYWDLQYVELK